MKSPEKTRGEPADSYTISDLEQLKVLADPLRLRILECFCRKERTTKQVAEILEEKPTKLYHHVDALQRVGLIRLARTKQNRGTLEKYYLAVARRFEADPELFSAADRQKDDRTEGLQSMSATLLARTSQELSQLIARGDAHQAIREEGLLSFVELHTSKERLLQLRHDLKALLESVSRDCQTEPPEEGAVRYRLTLAFFPLPEEE